MAKRLKKNAVRPNSSSTNPTNQTLSARKGYSALDVRVLADHAVHPFSGKSFYKIDIWIKEGHTVVNKTVYLFRSKGS